MLHPYEVDHVGDLLSPVVNGRAFFMAHHRRPKRCADSAARFGRGADELVRNVAQAVAKREGVGVAEDHGTF